MKESADLDRRDPLAGFRDEFRVPDGQIYLDGNSLGPLSTRAEAHVRRVLDDWRGLAVAGWLDASPPWLTLAEELGRRMAPLVGTGADEVVAANSTTVNIHQCLATLFRPVGRRSKILIDGLSFPTDRYAVRGHLRLRGLDPDQHLVVVPSRDGFTLSEAEILDAMTDEVQLALLPSVVYHSGQLLDMERLAQGAGERGVLIGFDCSHSVGVVPHRLGAWGVDFAVWSTYKFLNGGPGAVAGLFLARRHFGKGPGLPGWFGGRKDRMFAMADSFERPAEGRRRPANRHAADPRHGPAPGGDGDGRRGRGRRDPGEVARADGPPDGPGRVGACRVRLRVRQPPRGPPAGRSRGGAVRSTREALRLSKALRDAGVVPDFRRPDIIRLAPAPLYIRFADCDEAVRRLKQILDRRDYERYPGGPDLVT